MESFLVSTGIVALAEMGDKTQLLSLMLAARFRKPWPIVVGILIATLANHAGAGAFGAWVANLMGPQLSRWVLAASFLLMAVWVLIPDKLDEAEGDKGNFGVLLTTIVAFFLAEMGDKTQIATVALAARYDQLVAVVAGTTLGMMLANVPVVFMGDRLMRYVPVRSIHVIVALVFAVMAVMVVVWG
jgi:putative Ca2+/H+ antiporter (TMEM165/GDT1 family)